MGLLRWGEVQLLERKGSAGFVCLVLGQYMEIGAEQGVAGFFAWRYRIADPGPCSLCWCGRGTQAAGFWEGWDLAAEELWNSQTHDLNAHTGVRASRWQTPQNRSKAAALMYTIIAITRLPDRPYRDLGRACATCEACRCCFKNWRVAVACAAVTHRH